MLSKLIHRPVAVLLSITAAVILGVLATTRLPIGLLPEVGIPKLSVQVNYPNISARSLEQTVISPLRQQLLQLNGLQDIYSRCRDEKGIIYLDFPFGTNPDLAFIEVNEQVDRAMNSLPRELARPRVLATEVANIPVVELAITLKDTQSTTNTDLLGLSEQARRVFRRRIEQLSTVAFADLNGQTSRRVEIKPDENRMRNLNISESDLASLLQQANLETGSLLLADGHFVYSVRLTNRLTKPADIAALALNRSGRLVYLRDFASVNYAAEPAQGMFMHNGQRGVVFRIHKKSNSQLFLLQEELAGLKTELANQYPQFEFALLNDQSALLSASITNLQSGLIYGASFAILILFLFFREWRRPLLIALAVPVALLLALLGFYLVGLSINVISLAGLILGLGLMIDNSIIVLDNIDQLKRKGMNPTEAAWRGGQEVIGPLISSALTTVAVFLPLIFLNGLSGALFRDQAIAVSLALGASLLVAYFLLPLLSRGKKAAKAHSSHTTTTEFQNKTVDQANRNLAKRPVLLNRLLTLVILIAVLFTAFLLVNSVPQQGFPDITRSAFQLEIDWNESLSLEENQRRCLAITKEWDTALGGQITTSIGEQQFLLSQENRSTNEALLQFFLTPSASSLDAKSFATSLVKKWQEQHPSANLFFSPVPNLFDRVFSGDAAAELWLKVRNRLSQELPRWKEMNAFESLLQSQEYTFVGPANQEIISLSIDYEQLQFKLVNETALRNRLLSLFGEQELTQLRGGDQQIPVVIFMTNEVAKLSLAQLQEATIINQNGNEIPIGELLVVREEVDYKVITGDRAGPFIQCDFAASLTDQEKQSIIVLANTQSNLLSQWGGSSIAQQEQLQSLRWVLLVALLLLYLILAAQFESLVAPWVVLLTIPLSLVGSLVALWLTGGSLNLISMIGMVVTGGIVVNDAIIKLDMINRGRREMSLSMTAALQYANQRRIRAIIMTSLTTILALAPVLFASGLGAELQRPLAIAVIGGLAVGTLASLYILPVFYRALMK